MILKIEIEFGPVVTDDKGIENTVCSYFQNIFTSMNPSTVDIATVFQKIPQKVTEEMNAE